MSEWIHSSMVRFRSMIPCTGKVHHNGPGPLGLLRIRIVLSYAVMYPRDEYVWFTVDMHPADASYFKRHMIWYWRKRALEFVLLEY